MTSVTPFFDRFATTFNSTNNTNPNPLEAYVDPKTGRYGYRFRGLGIDPTPDPVVDPINDTGDTGDTGTPGDTGNTGNTGGNTGNTGGNTGSGGTASPLVTGQQTTGTATNPLLHSPGGTGGAPSGVSGGGPTGGGPAGSPGPGQASQGQAGMVGPVSGLPSTAEGFAKAANIANATEGLSDVVGKTGVIGNAIADVAGEDVASTVAAIAAMVNVTDPVSTFANLAKFSVTDVNQAAKAKMSQIAKDTTASIGQVAPTATEAAEANIAPTQAQMSQPTGLPSDPQGTTNSATDPNATVSTTTANSMAAMAGQAPAPTGANTSEGNANTTANSMAAMAANAKPNASVGQGAGSGGSSGSGGVGPGAGVGAGVGPAGPGVGGVGGGSSSVGSTGGSGGGGGGGGKIICLELHRQGLLDTDVFIKDEEFGDRVPKFILSGYHLWANPIVRKMRKDRAFSKQMAVLAAPVAKQLAYFMGHGNGSWLGLTMFAIGAPVCALLGLPSLFKGKENGRTTSSTA